MAYLESEFNFGKHEIENVYFTADHHFGHENVIEYCNRPFANIAEMNTALIDRWNEVIPEDGIVFHLGDFCLGKDAAKFMRQLNGIIYVLRLPWHHDKRWLKTNTVVGKLYYDPTNLQRTLAEFVSPLTIVRCRELEITITLSHYPLQEWEKSHYGAWHLHGHSHGNLDHKKRRVDVGVDVWDYAPVSFKQVKFFMEYKGI